MNKKAIIKAVRRQLRPLRRAWGITEGYMMLRKLRRHLASARHQKPHGLSGELIISLTSYGPRFSTIFPTLQCLTSQTVKPDRVILWISAEDEKILPEDVKNLAGLEVRTTRDMGPYTKVIPTLAAFPEAFVVTADDDAYYPPHWLEGLLQAWDGSNKSIVCHTAYRIRTDAQGMPVPYNDWKWNEKGPSRDTDLFFLGVGGVFYPPGSLLMPDVLDVETFLKLAPRADDIWLNWMARLAGSSVIKTGYNRGVPVWPDSQKVSLSSHNTGQSANDNQIKNMIEQFGFILG